MILLKNIINQRKKFKVITKENWIKQDKRLVLTSHYPLETILINTSNTQGTTLYNITKDEAGVKRGIKQNNYTNQSLNFIEKQLDKIENKIDKLPKQELAAREKPLVEFPDAFSSKIALKLNFTSEKLIRG